jgi:hypothetical protein
MSKKNEKKEKVIHTRISETLEQELKARASGLGVSVSNLVRNVLLTTFGRMEGMAREGADFARSISWHQEQAGAEAQRVTTGATESQQIGATVPASHPDRNVIGWQTLILELNAVCSRCNAILPRGSDAAIAVTMSPDEPRPLICPTCLDALRAE